MNTFVSIRRIADRQPDHPALRFEERCWSYAELLDEAARFATFLVDGGLEPGERVGIFMHNQPEWVFACLGTWQAGGVVVPYNHLFSPAALRHAVEDSGARWIVTPARDEGRLRSSIDGLAVADHLVVVGGSGPASWEELRRGHGPCPAVVPRRDGDDALLMYTSGSTGTPKGVRQTHRNTTAVCEATIDWWDFGPDDHALICTPLFHVGGLQLMVLPLLLAGGTCTLRRWDAAGWLDDAERLRPTYVALVPAMMIDILSHLGGRQVALDSVRVCAIGGSALPQARLGQLTAATGMVPVNIYGQTEQSGLAVTEPLAEDRREGSLGRPLEQIVEVRLVDPATEQTGGALAPGTVGELWVRGDAVSPGYWQLPEVNVAKFDDDGWFRTSDLVRADADGYLYYVERTDDLIISGGENVFPQMVEGHLIACPLVTEVAVIGTPDERLSQKVTAVVVPARPDVTVADIAAYCDGDANLRGLQRPRRIELVDAIPRTATNKIDRPALRKAFC